MDHSVKEICKVIQKLSGNILGDEQTSMVENRIKKRMLDLSIETFSDYSTYVKNNNASEIKILLGVLTTHHSYFFREMSHYDFLVENFDRLYDIASNRKNGTVRIWSAACAKGQEAYSLAMLLFHQMDLTGKHFKIEIIGTDIDISSVKHAQNGVYSLGEVKSIPNSFLKKYFRKGTGEIKNFVRISEQVRSVCSFEEFNLLGSDKVSNKKMDIIFCRNVLIYFSKKDVELVINEILNSLNNTGTLITGISESISHLENELFTIGPSIYCRNENPFVSHSVNRKELVSPNEMSQTSKKKRIIIVDDSKVVQKIFQTSLNKMGHIVVGVANNGVEANTLMKKLDVDLMLLDIHMPLMSGIEYLEKYFDSGHPPVVVVSSINRNDNVIIERIAELGVSDFIEKPELGSMKKTEDELSSKIAFLCKEDKLENNVLRAEALDPLKHDYKGEKFFFISEEQVPLLPDFFEEISMLPGSKYFCVVDIDNPLEATLNSRYRYKDRNTTFLGMTEFEEISKKTLNSSAVGNVLTKKVAESIKDFLNIKCSCVFLVEGTRLGSTLHNVRDIVPYTSLAYLNVKKVA